MKRLQGKNKEVYLLKKHIPGCNYTYRLKLLLHYITVSTFYTWTVCYVAVVVT